MQCILNDQNQSAYTSVTVNPLYHELRELQRCRNLGFSDTRQLSYEEWDSVHSATLEDYKINEVMDYLGQEISSLFHPDVQIE